MGEFEDQKHSLQEPEDILPNLQMIRMRYQHVKAAVKNRRTMSDADLKKKIERLKLEREFKNLTEDDIAPGRKYVSEILSASGKKALTVAAAGAMTYAVKTAMTKEFNLKEAAQYIAANPNKKK